MSAVRAAAAISSAAWLAFAAIAAFFAAAAVVQANFTLYLFAGGQVLAGPQELVNIYDLSVTVTLGVDGVVPAGTWIPRRAL